MSMRLFIKLSEVLIEEALSIAQERLQEAGGRRSSSYSDTSPEEEVVDILGEVFTTLIDLADRV